MQKNFWMTKLVLVRILGFVIASIFFFTFANAEIITEDKVKNYEYYLSFPKKKIKLKDGVYESGNSPENFKSVYIDRFLIQDLNEDDKPDAVVILVGNYGGSGFFYEVTALLSNGNEITQTNSIVLGDRIKIENLVISYSASFFPYLEINIHFLTHKETDSSCCPTEFQRVCFAVEGNKLIPCEEKSVVKKPAIYLYPEKKEEIKVKINPKGTILKTIPLYKGEWLVNATPEGKIDDKYDYLFYETTLDSVIPMSKEGWVVSFEHLSKWFDEVLPKLGLNEREIKDFKEYWLKELPFSKYYEIRLLSKDFVEENLSLDIEPKPQTLIRVIFHFNPTDKPSNLTEPIINKPERRGFTVVEWGGILKEFERSDIK